MYQSKNDICVLMYVLLIIHLITGHKILCLLQFNVMTNNSFRLQYMIMLYLRVCAIWGVYLCFVVLPNSRTSTTWENNSPFICGVMTSWHQKTNDLTRQEGCETETQNFVVVVVVWHDYLGRDTYGMSTNTSK